MLNQVMGMADPSKGEKSNNDQPRKSVGSTYKFVLSTMQNKMKE
jgi:hypothetical protein